MVIKNFYKVMPKEFNTSYVNPQYEKKHFIKFPFRMLICGSSGSMKTNTLLNLIHAMKGTFNHVVLCVKSAHEPLYEYLIDKLKKNITVYENGLIPALDTLKDKGQILAIFDDLVNSDQKMIVEYYIRSRKIAGGCACVYLSQSYYKVPKIIRCNANYLILKKLSSKRDLNLIMSEHNFGGVELKQLSKIYSDATEQKENFLLMDLDENKLYFNFTKDITPCD
jgi:hypothetical protein